MAVLETPCQAQGPVLTSSFPARALESLPKAVTLLHFKDHLPQASLGHRENASFSHWCGFPHRHSHAGPTKAQARGWGRGGGGVALLHGKIKPFVREQGPTVACQHLNRIHGATGRVGAQGGQVALFGITDIALRCSGTLSKLPFPCQSRPVQPQSGLT